MIDLFGNLFNPSPPTPSWSLVTNPRPHSPGETAHQPQRVRPRHLLRTRPRRQRLPHRRPPRPHPRHHPPRSPRHRERRTTHPHPPPPGCPRPRTLRRQATAILTTHQPDARPADPEDPELPTPDLSPDFTIDTTDTDYTVFQITLPTDEAIGATRIIDAIATAHNTSRATAFTELLHGTTGEVKVTLNCYRNLDTGDMHLENHKLTGIAPDTWMRRVTDLTVPSHSTHHGRFATEAQKALIAGIDGTCRAPGCDNPAATADADHIHRYDNNPHTGTREMQSLCRRCHILKTLGLTDYTRLTDGTTIVSSIDDNHTVTTGPLAHANLTFDRRLAHKPGPGKSTRNSATPGTTSPASPSRTSEPPPSSLKKPPSPSS